MVTHRESSAETQVRALVRRYYDGWRQGRFEDAIAQLAPDVAIEVPINAYPDRASFGQALASFGALVDHVELLSELFDGEQAILLYDMHVRGLGALRVAEHFTVRDGRIVRLRQIHDTAAVRAAGFAEKA